MKPIKGTDKAEQVIGRWYPVDMAEIRSFHYRHPDEGEGPQLEIEFLACRRDLAKGGWPSTAIPNYTVLMQFSGVLDLRLETRGGNSQIMGFDIEDVSGRGWERIHHLISDYEEDLIAFGCRDIEILAVAQCPAGAGDYRNRTYNASTSCTIPPE